ncbi:MAG: dUTP diphosphatase [Bacilli bacterium]
MKRNQSLKLAPFFTAQAELDADIHQKHDTNYQKNHRMRLLSFLVELGELANATRCFKFWSLKGSESKEVVLDEYADALHFLLSLGLVNNHFLEQVEILPFSGDLTEGFLQIYQACNRYEKELTFAAYQALFNAFFQIIPLLNAELSEVETAYFKKHEVNYQRQKNNY